MACIDAKEETKKRDKRKQQREDIEIDIDIESETPTTSLATDALIGDEEQNVKLKEGQNREWVSNPYICYVIFAV